MNLSGLERRSPDLIFSKVVCFFVTGQNLFWQKYMISFGIYECCRLTLLTMVILVNRNSFLVVCNNSQVHRVEVYRKVVVSSVYFGS